MKRTFTEIRKKILKALKEEQKTVNQLSKETKINWKTVDNHITYILGKGFAEIVFESKYVKIYQISEKGKEEIKQT